MNKTSGCGIIQSDNKVIIILNLIKSYLTYYHFSSWHRVTINKALVTLINIHSESVGYCINRYISADYVKERNEIVRGIPNVIVFDKLVPVGPGCTEIFGALQHERGPVYAFDKKVCRDVPNVKSYVQTNFTSANTLSESEFLSMQSKIFSFTNP